MSQQFKSMTELTEYLANLEERIIILEEEKREIKKRIAKEEKPKTNLLSNNFLKRAFAVWGHFFTAHLIVTVIFGSIYFCFVVILLNQMIGSIIQIPEITLTPAYLLAPTPIPYYLTPPP